MKVITEGGGFVVLCDSCGSRVAWLQGDCLILRKKHHGEKHVTVLPLQELLSLAKLDDVRKTVRAIS